MKRLYERRQLILFVASTLLLLGGGVAWLIDLPSVAALCWDVGTVAGLVASVVWTAGAVRRRQPTVDIIAVLALAGALAIDEPFAGAMVTVMLASGQLLEARAAARARRELSLLLELAPRTAHRRTGSGVVDVAVDEIARGDLVLVGSGEVVPVDGRLVTEALLDEAAMTGEPLPVERGPGDEVRSGVVNAGAPLDLVATATSAESTYAGLVRLVEQAQARSAPFVRTADRFAVYFVPLTLLLAIGAWVASADPVRAVAVLVVATPCPLLLAAPIAFMSGLSQAARRGVVVKGGGALERLAVGRVMLFDKTGTLTAGRPAVANVVTANSQIGPDDLLRLAASLDQVSPHVLATAIVTAAVNRGLGLQMPEDVVEEHGYGVRGPVGAHGVQLGKASWIVPGEPPAWVRQVRRRADLDGSLTVFAAVDDAPAGAFLLEDSIRPDAPRMVRALRAAGIPRVVLVTGDRADIADMVGRIVGVDTVLADRDPADKLAAIEVSAGPPPRSWSATASTTHRRWPRPVSAWRWPPAARPRRPRPPTSCSPSIGSTRSPMRSSSRAGRSASRCRPSSSAWGCHSRRWPPPPPGYCHPPPARSSRRASTSWPSASRFAPSCPERCTRCPSTRPICHARRLKVQHDAILAVVEQIRTVADGLSTQSRDLRRLARCWAGSRPNCSRTSAPTRRCSSRSSPALSAPQRPPRA